MRECRLLLMHKHEECTCAFFKYCEALMTIVEPKIFPLNCTHVHTYMTYAHLCPPIA